jgi:PAS domain S-box-containing protein
MERPGDRLSAASVALLGTVLAVVALYDAWYHVGREGRRVAVVAAGSAVPLLADGALVVAGVALLRGRSDSEFARRSGPWTLTGGVLVGGAATVVFATHTDLGVAASVAYLTHLVAVGGVGGLVAAYFNAGEKRRRAESERERNRLRALFENSSDCIATTEFTDEGTIVRDVNPAFERVFGYDAAAIRGRSIDEVLAPHRTEEAETLSERASRGERVETTVERRTADGDVRTFRLQALPVDEPGHSRPRAGFAVYSDRTDDERFLRQLTGLHDYTRRLMGVTEPSDVVAEAIPAAHGLLGFEVVTVFTYDEGTESLRPELLTAAAREVLGDDIDPLPLVGSVAGRAFRENERVVAGDIRDDPDVANPDSPLRSEMLFPLDGFGVFVVASRRADAFDDRDVALAEILADNVEAALARATRETEVREQKERLDEFASVVSHDLRNPLHTAQGYLDLAREDGDGAHLERVENALTRMDRLVDDLLALARGEQRIDDEETHDLESVVGAAWQNAETRSARLRVPDELGTVRADRSRLEELLGNLFRNAVEHGGDDVTVTVGRLDEGGFYVADDGRGIDESVHEDLFEAGVTTAADGTGFGTAIVDRIVDAHGWSVRAVESADGGARFEIRTDPTEE